MRTRSWLTLTALLLGCTHPSPAQDDAGSPDAGLPDAGATDDAGTHPSGPGTCGQHSYRLCEDFESATVGQLPADWTLKTNFGDNPTSPAVVDDVAHTGSKALRSTSAAEGQNRIQRSLTSLGATAGTHWGRVFFKVKQPVPLPAGGGFLHGTFIAYQGASDEIRVMDWVRANPSGHVEINYQLAQGDFDRSTDYLPQYDFNDQWRCVEWYVDAVTHSYRYFLDGEEATALAFTGQPSSALQSFPSVILGTLIFQTIPASLTVWFDDFALDDARIGCGS